MKDQDLIHKQRRDLLVRQISNVQKGGYIKIYAGEMNCFVYDHDEVDRAVKAAVKRGVRISVVAGPALSVREESGSSRVVDWVREGLISLHCKQTRHHDEHFRLLCNYAEGEHHYPKYVYAERPHEAMLPGNRIKLADSDMEFWFDENEKDFDFLAEQYGKLTADPLEVFLPLTPSQLEQAKTLADLKRGRDSFNYLTKEDIEDLMKIAA